MNVTALISSGSNTLKSDAVAECDSRFSVRIRRLALALMATLTIAIAGCENVSVGNQLPALDDDAPLSQAVVHALARNPEVGQFSISVKSLDGGTVRLSGHVDNDAQKHTAEQVAARVDGVRNVVNTLFIRD